MYVSLSIILSVTISVNTNIHDREAASSSSDSDDNSNDNGDEASGSSNGDGVEHDDNDDKHGFHNKCESLDEGTFVDIGPIIIPAMIYPITVGCFNLYETNAMIDATTIMTVKSCTM
jgi:hypothetical protein